MRVQSNNRIDFFSARVNMMSLNHQCVAVPTNSLVIIDYFMKELSNYDDLTAMMTKAVTSVCVSFLIRTIRLQESLLLA